MKKDKRECRLMAAEKATLIEQVRKRFFKAEKVVLLFRNKVHCKLQ